MIPQVVGNVPGLQNAGVMWAGEFTAFFLEFGFTQSIVDRRLFYLHDRAGLLLMVGTFVDDCKAVVQFEAMAVAFNNAWEKRYRDPPDVDATARDFLGLKYNREEGTTAAGCGKALGNLVEKLEGLMPRRGGGGAVPTAPPRFLRRRCASSSTAPDPTTR